MKKIFLLCFFLITQIGFSQNDAALIERKGNLVLNRYYILGQEVNERQVLRKIKPYEPAHKMFKSSRRWGFTSSIIAGFGAGAIMPSLFNPSPEITITLLITVVSLIAIAVPIKQLANRKADEAIEMYNSRRLMGETKIQRKLNISLTTQGIGLQLIF